MDVYSCCYSYLIAKGKRKRKREVLVFSLIVSLLAKIKKAYPSNHKTITGNGTLSYHQLPDNYLKFPCLNFLTVNFPLYVGNEMTFSK